MKIAVVSDDGQHISRHFGWAPYYVVLDVSDSQVVSQEVRPKAGHHQEAGTAQPAHAQGAHAHHNPGLHNRMVENIRDCQVVLAGGMGGGAYAALTHAGLQVHLTDQSDIKQAVEHYLKGELPNQADLRH